METMLRRYAAAMLPDTRYVLGRRMEPFALGHALLLTRLDSPFVRNEPEALIRAGDLRLAILLCSRPYSEAVRIAASRYAWVRLACMRIGPQRLQDGAGQMLRYIDAGSTAPEAWQDQSAKGWRLRTPFILQVKIVMKSAFGLSEAEALGTPFGQAIWEFSAYAEMKGQRRLVGDEDANVHLDAEEAMSKFGAELKAFREQMAGMSHEDLIAAGRRQRGKV